MEKNRVEFDKENHIYRLDGVIAPGVTQVLRQTGITDFSFIKQSDLDFGLAVHLATELCDRNDLDYSTVHPLILPYLDGWKKFLKEFKPAIELIEQCLCSVRLKYGLTIDRVMRINGRRTIVDIKTSVDPTESEELQTAAYLLGYNENMPYHKALDRAVVHINNKGEYKYIPHKNKSDVNEWLVCLSFYNILKRRNRLCTKPLK